MGPSADPAISFLHSPERRSAFIEKRSITDTTVRYEQLVARSGG